MGNYGLGGRGRGEEGERRRAGWGLSLGVGTEEWTGRVGAGRV